MLAIRSFGHLALALVALAALSALGGCRQAGADDVNARPGASAGGGLAAESPEPGRWWGG